MSVEMNLYVIYDSVAEESGPVFEAKNDLIAQRNFINFCKKMEHVEDFRIFKVGSVDHSTNVVIGLKVPVEIFSDLMEQKEVNNEPVF